MEDTRDVLADVKVGLEIEFYLFEGTPSGSAIPQTSDVGGYFDLMPTDRGEDARLAIVGAMDAMGIPIASAHHEHGPGQHEIDLDDLGALAAADALTTMRTVTRHIAAGLGLHATFMPKPAETLAGSGLPRLPEVSADRRSGAGRRRRARTRSTRTRSSPSAG